MKSYAVLSILCSSLLIRERRERDLLMNSIKWVHDFLIYGKVWRTRQSIEFTDWFWLYDVPTARSHVLRSMLFAVIVHLLRGTWCESCFIDVRISNVSRAFCFRLLSKSTNDGCLIFTSDGNSELPLMMSAGQTRKLIDCKGRVADVVVTQQ